MKEEPVTPAAKTYFLQETSSTTKNSTTVHDDKLANANARARHQYNKTTVLSWTNNLALDFTSPHRTPSTKQHLSVRHQQRLRRRHTTCSWSTSTTTGTR